MRAYRDGKNSKKVVTMIEVFALLIEPSGVESASVSLWLFIISDAFKSYYSTSICVDSRRRIKLWSGMGSYSFRDTWRLSKALQLDQV